MSDSEPRAVAVLGTGGRGTTLARDLARAGHEVTAWDGTGAASDAPEGAGVVVADTPEAAVRDAEIVLTVLADAPTVLAVMAAAAPGLRAGTAWLQSTSVPLDAIAELGTFAREHGLVLVDAPLLDDTGEDGSRTALAAGPPQVRRFVAPALDAIAARTVWTGDDAEAGTATLRALDGEASPPD
jgi:3-hydroxyisobutyrate dehydrogenase